MGSVVINVNGAKKKLAAINGRGRYLAANQAMTEMERFVPFSGKQRSVHLRDTAEVDNSGSLITYNTPYAKAQFFGFVGVGGFRVKNYTTPGTSRRWDLRLKSNPAAMANVEEAFKGGLE